MTDRTVTKEAMGNALKELVIKKGFDKISINDITGACGLGRQSFYYHFQDKYQLLEWVFREGAMRPLHSDVTIKTWPKRLEQTLMAMEAERRFYISAIKAQPEFFSRCFSEEMEPLFSNLADCIYRYGELSDTRRNFGAEFYALGCSAVVTRWACDGMRTPAFTLARNIYLLSKEGEWACRHNSDNESNVF